MTDALNPLTKSSSGGEALRAYIDGGNEKVAGWLEPLALRSIVTLDDLHKEFGVCGGMCEIGVHRGRLLILLHLMARADERTVGFDLFELMSPELITAYGAFDKAEILATLMLHSCDLDRIDLVAADSTGLSAEDVLQRTKQAVRIFSVDGGHDAETALSDMLLAERTTCPGGVVLLDDAFNEQWVGVIEAAARYLLQSDHRLVPFLLAGNKMFFTTGPAEADNYRSRMQRALAKASQKVEKFFGYPVLIAWPTPLSTRAHAISLILGDSGLQTLRRSRRLLKRLGVGSRSDA